MPGSDTPGIIADVKIVAARGDSPEEMTLGKVFVIHGDDVWVSAFSNEPRPSPPPGTIEGIARNGPS